MRENVYDQTLRKWFPRRFINRGMRHLAVKHKKEMQTAKTTEERRELIDAYNEEMYDLDSWLQSIEDAKAVKQAAMMDIALDDIPLPAREPGDEPGHWMDDAFGNRCLKSDTRRAIHRIMRERAPAFRKEGRERLDLYLKIVLAVGSAVTGIGGTLIGLLSVLKK